MCLGLQVFTETYCQMTALCLYWMVKKKQHGNLCIFKVNKINKMFLNLCGLLRQMANERLSLAVAAYFSRLVIFGLCV